GIEAALWMAENERQHALLHVRKQGSGQTQFFGHNRTHIGNDNTHFGYNQESLSMTHVDRLAPNDDVPKTNPWGDDRLGFKPFAERLFKVILKLHVPDGYVIGMHGEWCSGKTTALNFVRAFLDKHNQEAEDQKDRVRIVDFQPWIVSGHQDLIAA